MAWRAEHASQDLVFLYFIWGGEGAQSLAHSPHSRYSCGDSNMLTIFNRGPTPKHGTNPASTEMSRVAANRSPCHAAVSEPLPVSHAPPPSYHPEPTILDTALRGAYSSSPIDVDDIVIAVMGITRAGKSSFINKAAGRTEIPITNDLASQTRTVQPVRCLHPDGRRNVVLVDTPGFDDTHLSDAQTLRILTHWLKETYQNNIKLSGLLYLHRISDNRMAGTPLRHLSVFKELCGENSMKNIVLVTTMWDDVDDSSIGFGREEQLLSVFWKDMIRLGSRTCRFQGTYESAWEIIDHLDLESSSQRRAPLQIQQEMVDRGLQLHQTGAAKALIRSLTKRVEDVKKIWAKLSSVTRRTNCPGERSHPLGLRKFQSRSSTVVSSSSEVSWPAESISSACSTNSRQDTVSATVRLLEIDCQKAELRIIPMLLGTLRMALSVARLIQDMDGTHHAIVGAIECFGWLLHDTTEHAMRSALSIYVQRALSSFQGELYNLERAVRNISARERGARFFLHEADLQVLTGCTASMKAVYNELDLANHRHMISQLEDQVTALWANPEQRRCECRMPAEPLGKEFGHSYPTTGLIP